MDAQRSANEYAFFDLQPEQADDLAELVAGLQQAQKRVSPKFFYDAAGSQLFDEITQLEEYYLTRTEMALFDRHHDQIAEALRGSANASCLVEYGSGSSGAVGGNWRIRMSGLSCSLRGPDCPGPMRRQAAPPPRRRP